MKASLFLTVFSLLFASLMSLAEEKTDGPVQPTGFLFKTIEVDGRNYDYAVYLPRDYAERASWPLIMFLHGKGESGTDGSQQIGQGIGRAILRQPQRWPFVVVFPQKPDAEDQWEQHEAAVMAMLRETEKTYRVDATRRYLTGLSQGGHGTMVLGARHPDLWAAMVPICGYLKPFEPAAVAEELTGMPIWCFHGDADQVVPVAESIGFVEAVRAAGGEAKLTLYPGVGHNSWDQAYSEEDLPAWFLSHTKKEK